MVLRSRSYRCVLLMHRLLTMVAIGWTAADNYGSLLLSGSNLVWPSAAAESEDARSGRYDARKILVHGVQMDENRAYVTMPRFAKTGVPWTLGVVRLDTADFEPDIRPYPDYGHHLGGGGGARIVNAVDAYLEDGVLWTLDAGTANTFGRPVRLGPPQVVGIDAFADAVVRTVDLSAVVRPHSTLQRLVARRTVCGRLFVYVADAAAGTIVTYDADADRLHAIPLPERVSVARRRRAVLHMVAVGRGGKSYLYFTYQHGAMVYALDAWSAETVAYGAVSEVGVKPVAGMRLLGSDRGTNVYFRVTGGGGDVWSWDVNRPLDVGCFALVHRGYMYLTPTVVVAGWRHVVWALESNGDEYAAGDVDCTGARTLLRPLRHSVARDCEDRVAR